MTQTLSEVELSYCIVNTSQRRLLLRGLDAVERERAGLPFASEVLVLDNGSRDGSAQAAREHPALAGAVRRAAAGGGGAAAEQADGVAGGEVIALGQRRGKALNDSELLRRARGRYALLLNEDSELLPGATLELHAALQARPEAACAGAQLLRPDASGGVGGSASPQPCAWRFPGVPTALAGALFLHRLCTVQSKGRETREVDWCQSSALLVRREAAAQVGYLDPAFFVYSDEVDFAKRLRDAGWRSLYVPSARAIHHEQLSTDLASAEPRIVEMARNRDLYMRKHHSRVAALAVRWLTAWPYALRALAALALPGHSPRRYWRHVTATLRPSRGEGLREAAERYNRDAA
ncbi:MAG TPA: glycosyltransferase [Methylomirabilota bacterium]|nr:glycosyltransferase [Methylomirabilota bacterium]